MLLSVFFLACTQPYDLSERPQLRISPPKLEKIAVAPKYSMKDKKIGASYRIRGQTFKPRAYTQFEAEGVASWYGRQFHGKKTANGEIFDKDKLTAAHPTLPLPSYVLVTNLQNNRSVVLRVNDRGPFVKKRIIDVSQRASEVLGFRHDGLARVRLKMLDDEEGRQIYIENVVPKPLKRFQTAPCKKLQEEKGDNNEQLATISLKRPGSCSLLSG
ncbi:MAG: septal ring lytic transglycosylase RlpA family protein [Alphaproteobacteria bacterium]